MNTDYGIGGGGAQQQPQSRVELTLAARNLADTDILSKSDPLCLVEELRPALRPKYPGEMVWTEVGRTERLDNTTNPEWNRKVGMDYFFEMNQQIRFRVFDIDNAGPLENQDYLGDAQCLLAEVVAAPEGVLVVPLKLVRKVPGGGNRGQLNIRAEEIKSNSEKVNIIAHGHQLDVHKSVFPMSLLKGDNKLPFLEFFRLNLDGTRQMVHRTEKSAGKNTEWHPFTLATNYLAPGGDQNAQFLVECRDFRANGSHRLIGGGQTSLAKLLSARPQERVVELVKGDIDKHVGEIRFVQFDVYREHSFLDFIASGLQLEFAVAIDFTASNGQIYSPQSLHYCSSAYPNQYEMATRAVLNIVEHYNRSKLFEASGFGANVAFPGSGNHLAYSDFFPLRLDTYDTFVEGVEGVMEAYRIALNNCTLHGPTNFSPTIEHYAAKTREFPRDGKRYQVLLIITDGQITDMVRTKQALIDASVHPLSVIIVGVGRADFQNMDELDSDKRLLSHGGRRAKRDIVQFVPFRDFLGAAQIDGNLSVEHRNHIQAQLAKEVLAELPAQVTGWMKANGIHPTMSLGGGLQPGQMGPSSPPASAPFVYPNVQQNGPISGDY